MSSNILYSFKPLRCGRGNVLFTFFCVLFSLLVFTQAVAQTQSESVLVGEVRSAADGQTMNQQSPNPRLLLNLEKAIVKSDYSKFEGMVRKQYPEVDFEQFPLVQYEVDTTQIGYILKGEVIPDKILDMPLWVYNHPSDKKETTLRELSDRKFLVLDFWAEWCSPCIASMDNWESILPSITDSIRVVGVHVGADCYTPFTLKERNWNTTQILGGEAALLSRYFTRWSFVGPSAWIKDGRLFGISTSAKKSNDYIFKLMKGEIDAIPKDLEWELSR